MPVKQEISTYGLELIRRFLNSVVNLEHIHKMRRETQFSGFDPEELFTTLDPSQQKVTANDLKQLLEVDELDAELLILKISRFRHCTSACLPDLIAQFSKSN